MDAINMFNIIPFLVLLLNLLPLLLDSAPDDLLPPHPPVNHEPWCHNDESSALLEFKQSLLIEDDVSCYHECSSGVVSLASWERESSPGNHCCSWEGVECDKHRGHVIGLDLSCACLSGFINSTSSLFRLVHLQKLNLSNNYFNDSLIPHAIGNLSKLETLDLSHSDFVGQIPPQLLTLANLSVLDLHDANGGLELKKPNIEDLARSLTKLQLLNLEGVDISAPFPDAMANLSSLRSLSLSSTNLLGEVPTAIFELPNLQVLDLSFNAELAGRLPEFDLQSRRSSSSLVSIDLGGTNFSGELPASIGNLNFLSKFDANHCGFQGVIPSSLWSLVKLSHLDLSFNLLSGQIPSSIGSLVKLSYLDLSSNQLSGQIPSSIESLVKLSYLDLSSNQLSGQIPSSIESLVKLSYLDLRSNLLSGQIPSSIESLVKLSYLDLSSNDLTGPIPPSIDGLQQQLSYLNLSSNKLTGRLPSQLGNLTRITIADLSSNGFSGPIPSSISQLSNLTYLNLRLNKLDGILQFDMMFLQLKSLTDLHLSFNQLSVIISTKNMSDAQPKLQSLGLASCNLKSFPEFLQGQDELELLDLSYNNISGQVPDWFLQVSPQSMSVLNLSNNSLTGFSQYPVHFNWSGIIALNLRSNDLRGSLPIPPEDIFLYLVSDNRLSGQIPSSICNASYFGVLELSSNNFVGVVPQCLNSVASMLSLKNNFFHGNIPQANRSQCNLEMIDLSDNQFQGPVPKSLENCTRLEFLNLGKNMINGRFPSWLGSLSNLRVLILHSNNFTGVLGEPKSDSEFPGLQIVDLSRNNFAGFLPSKLFRCWISMTNLGPDRYYYYIGQRVLSNIDDSLLPAIYDYTLKIFNKGLEMLYPKISTYLVVIDLSSNNFSGEIPESISGLGAVRLLNLSNNFLTGHIPTSLKELSNLEALDLSRNMLTGEIPGQFTQLTSLEFFNVSNNQLVGPIPEQKNQFGTFDNNSYRGNTRLCGAPLSKKCGDDVAIPSPSQDDEDSDDSFELIDWKIIMMGIASGLVIGVVLGQGVTVGSNNWFVRKFGRDRRRRRS